MYSTIMAATSSIKPNGGINGNGEIINLPSGKIAIQQRPSLKGLKKFSEIEKLRKEMKDKKDDIDYDGMPQTTSNHNNEIKGYTKMKYKIIKWSVGIMIIGAIGGLGYYYVDKLYKKEHNIDGDDGIIIKHGNLWKESIISYVQSYWNWMIGINNNDENGKRNGNGNGNRNVINVTNNDKTE